MWDPLRRKGPAVENGASPAQSAPSFPAEDVAEGEGGGVFRERAAARRGKAVLAAVIGGGLAVAAVIPQVGGGRPWRGVVRAQEWWVSSRIDGTAARVFVANGRFVKMGDLLVELDSGTLGADQTAARERLIHGQADLLAMGTEIAISKAELQDLRSAMSVREEALRMALLSYLRIRKITGWKKVSAAAVHQSEKTLRAELAGYLNANLAFSNAGSLLEEKQAASNALAASLRRVEDSLSDANWRLLCTKIYAPVEGRVVLDKAMFAEPITAGKPFLKIVAGEPWVVADLDAAQLNRIRAGTRATITVEALKARTFYGQVASVGSVAYAGRSGRRWWGWVLPFLQPRETAPVKITFETDSLLGFEDRLEPGLPALVECSPELPLGGTQPSAENHRTPIKEVAGN